MPKEVASFVTQPGMWLKRLLARVCSQADADLRRIRSDPAAGIHALRVRMKKLRSLLRLAEDQVPAATLKLLRRRIRAVKNAFAINRDLEVMQALAAKLSLRHDLPPPALRPAAPCLTPDTKVPAPVLAEARCELAKLRHDFGRLQLERLSCGDLIACYASSQLASRRAMDKCAKDPKPRKLHRWRKHVKEWHYLSLALHCLPHARKCVRPSRNVGRWLGRAHDLALLDAHVTGASRREWHRVIRKRFRKLCSRAFTEARKPLSRTPHKLHHLLEREAAALLKSTKATGKSAKNRARKSR